jgi:hypothetical protein
MSSLHIQPLDRLRLERGLAHLDRLGPRAKAEFWIEFAGRVATMPAMLRLMAEWEQRLTPALVRTAGGDWPLRRPLHVVPR